jgi:hypothetical protein
VAYFKASGGNEETLLRNYSIARPKMQSRDLLVSVSFETYQEQTSKIYVFISFIKTH